MTGDLLVLPAILVMVAVYGLALIVIDLVNGGMTASEERGDR